MTGNELRKKFLDFFQSKGHTIVLSSSLIPDDPSVLLTTAGMQQFKKYYTGELDPMTAIHPTRGKPLGSYCAASVQKSFRTSDIDEVGDATHLTFFEMLGNFSFGGGGYFKEKAIQYAYEFITKILGLPIDYVSVFGGDKDIPADSESEKIWRLLDSRITVKKFGRDDNFWGPTGSEGPCGPTTEIYVSGTEIWNIVFNEYYYPGSREELLGGLAAKSLEKLKTPGVDTGMGLERLAMIVQKKPSIFDTDLFQPIFNSIINIIRDKPIKKIRIIIDHLRAATFLVGDGITPSNTDRGYILRRLIRRAMIAHYRFVGAGINAMFYVNPVSKVIDIYGSEEQYGYLIDNKDNILRIIGQETERFSKTLANGLKILGREMQAQVKRANTDYSVQNLSSGYTPYIITGKWLFDFYQSFGFPQELTLEVVDEILGRRYSALEKENLKKDFDKEFEKHQEISRAGAEKKFGGHGLLLNTGELKAANKEELKKVTRLHTATHLLHAALRKILGDSVRQMGSDITAERARFDFSFDRKLTDDEKKQIENLVNDAINKGYNVAVREMPYHEAIEQGALHFFKEKYPERVKVYSIGPDTSIRSDTPFSRELCGGPHVKNTNEIGHFRILKEEAVASGVRRIRATVE